MAWLLGLTLLVSFIGLAGKHEHVHASPIHCKGVPLPIFSLKKHQCYLLVLCNATLDIIETGYSQIYCHFSAQKNLLFCKVGKKNIF